MFTAKVELALGCACLIWVACCTFLRLIIADASLGAATMILTLNSSVVWLAYGILTKKKKGALFLAAMLSVVIAIYLLWHAVRYPLRDIKPGVEEQMFAFMMMCWVAFFALGVIARGIHRLLRQRTSSTGTSDRF